MSPAAAEIARIEHELDILRSRYANFERSARITKWLFIGLALIITSLWVVCLVYDPLAAALVAGIAFVLGGAIYLTRGDPEYRWIDVVSLGRLGARISEAEAIERMIVERETRLAEIGRRQV
jgi:hypothetical protein